MNTSLLRPSSFRSSGIALLTWGITIFLGLGILPSFTALSTSLASTNPALALVGPINFLKLASPLIAILIWLRLREFSRAALFTYAFLFSLGSLATIIAVKLCGFGNLTTIREWAAMTFGALCALGFCILDSRKKFIILLMWCCAIYGLAFVDKVFPIGTDWLYANVFDPSTKWFDAKTSDARILSGVYGFQSLAKLLCWLPWLIFVFVKRAQYGWGSVIWVIFTAGSTGLILSTTQRGPLLGMAIGWLAFSAHLSLRSKKKHKAIRLLVSGAVLSIIATWAFTPTNIFAARLGSLANNEAQRGKEANLAKDNVNFRIQMWLLSIRSIQTSPLGNVCIPNETFAKYGVYSAHSHNLFIQQFRDRGWGWGITHLLLWFFALVFSWRSRTIAAAGLFAGLTCICVQGQFDHPWFVMNHALLLSIYLTTSFALDDRRLWERGNSDCSKPVRRKWILFRE